MVGGVCALLEYDVDAMADYVSEMSNLVANSNMAQPAPSFHKFIQQILTSAQLPKTTILLGMNYFAQRINMLRSAGMEKFSGEG